MALEEVDLVELVLLDPHEGVSHDVPGDYLVNERALKGEVALGGPDLQDVFVLLVGTLGDVHLEEHGAEFVELVVVAGID